MMNIGQIAPPLTADFYAESYELRKAASTMTTNAIDWFRGQARNLLNRGTNKADDKIFSVLSVGSGEGDIDIEIIHALLEELSPQWEKLNYVALEPNAAHRASFMQRIDECSLDQRVNISIRDQRIEELDVNEHQQHYDLILFIHVFYYFDAPQQIIENALTLIKASGQVIIVHQTAIGIPEIQQRYMHYIKGNADEMFTTADIQDLLDIAMIPHQYQEIDANLNVTECLRQTEAGLKIMSFCMECDLRSLNITKFGEILQAFEDLAVIHPNGDAFIREPIGLFTLQAPHTESMSSNDKRNSNSRYNSNGFDHALLDTDPVDDYRQLAKHLDWTTLLASKSSSPYPHASAPLRILDVACGTGRWLDALYHYVPFQNYLNDTYQLFYDILDPSETAIAQIGNKIRAPFQLGNQYVTTMQNATLEKQAYDLLWSNHGFYGIPTSHLPFVLTKCMNSLRETGLALIALANRSSFYITFYDQFLATVPGCNGTGFTAAEDVIAALTMLGIPHQIDTLCYKECIETDDQAGLAHYIINESTINSFSKDEDLTDTSISRAITLEELRSYPQLEQFIELFRRGSAYYFPQQVEVISFGNSSPTSRLIRN